MAKNEQSREANQPIWFDGKSINEALFCDDFLGRHKIIYTNGAFFTPDGRVTDELPLRGEIFEELKCCAVSNIPRKISNKVGYGHIWAGHHKQNSERISEIADFH